MPIPSEILAKDIFEDLLHFYPLEYARKLYCITALRTVTPDIVNEEISAEY